MILKFKHIKLNKFFVNPKSRSDQRKLNHLRIILPVEFRSLKRLIPNLEGE